MKFIFVFFLFCCLAGCRDKKSASEIPVISLSKPEAEESFNANEIISNLRLVKLETHAEALLPEFFNTWIGEKYILILGREEFLMFSLEGKFLRKIAQQGRGPEEFVSFINYDVDESKERLYISDGVGSIDLIDLKKGGVIQRFRGSSGSPNKLIVNHDHNVTAFFSLPQSDILCQLDTLLTLKWYVENFRQQDVTGSFYLGELDGVLRYKLGFCDTLYTRIDGANKPYCRMTTDRLYSVERESGNSVDIAFENRDLFILKQNFIEVYKSPGTISSTTMTLGTYWCDKDDFKVKKMVGLYLDIFDYTYPQGFPFEVCGKKAVWNLSVANYKKILENCLDNPAVADSLKTLYQELQEEDNPVLLIGDVK